MSGTSSLCFPSVFKRVESDFSFDDAATPQDSALTSKQAERINRDRNGAPWQETTYKTHFKRNAGCGQLALFSIQEKKDGYFCVVSGHALPVWRLRIYTHIGGVQLGGFANCIRYHFVVKRNMNSRPLLLARAVTNRLWVVAPDTLLPPAHSSRGLSIFLSCRSWEGLLEELSRKRRGKP